MKLYWFLRFLYLLHLTDLVTSSPVIEQLTVMIVGGFDGKIQVYPRSTEIITVKKTLANDVTMEVKQGVQLPSNFRLDGRLEYMYMARIGSSNTFFLKAFHDSYLFDSDTSTWTKTSAPQTPYAYYLPAISWGSSSFMVFGSYRPFSPEIKLFASDFTSETVGRFPDYYQPWNTHKVAKVNETSFIVTGGKRHKNNQFLDGAVLGSLGSSGKITWTALQPMRYRRTHHCAFVLGGKVVVMGGRNSGDREESVEYLDLSKTPLSTQSWQEGPDLPYKVCFHSCSVTRGGSFAIITGGRGDYGGYGYWLDKVLLMNEDLKATLLPQKLHTLRGFHQSVVLQSEIDKCISMAHPCHTNADCTNTVGSYTCTCKDGYTGDGKASCTDIDECISNTHKCHSNADCTNTLGSYTCSCKDGYTGDGKASCKDIDECVSMTHKCHANADCTNTAGGYTCSCRDGYNGDGKVSCTDINECISTTHKCHANADCANIVGGYTCSCKDGYNGDGKVSCTDINECTSNTHKCHTNADCTNTLGSYTCSCKNGYTGDGKTSCKDLSGFQLICDHHKMTGVWPKTTFHSKVSATLQDPDCNIVHENKTHFWIGTKLSECKTQVRETEESIYYSNKIHLTTTDIMGIAKRVANRVYNVECGYSRKLNVATRYSYGINGVMMDDLKSEPPTYNISIDSDFSATMNFFSTSSFADVVETPVSVTSAQTMFVGINQKGSTDNLKFVVNRCYATSSEDTPTKRNDMYLFFVDKCPIDPTFKMIKSDNNKFHFSIKAFEFIDVKKTVVFHCHMFICLRDSASPACQQHCPVTRRRRRREVTSNEPLSEMTVRSGQVKIIQKPTL